MDVVAETKLFVELDWWVAGLVIAGGVLVGKLAYDVFVEVVVGSFWTPPEPSGRHRRDDQDDSPEQGWYDAGDGRQRFWDGKRWTDKYRPTPER